VVGGGEKKEEQSMECRKDIEWRGSHREIIKMEVNRRNKGVKKSGESNVNE
jgi:hypothetical protein